MHVTASAQSVEFRVRYAETDQMGVVYHAAYLVWCDIGRTEFMRAAGISYAQVERDGVALAVSEAAVRYHAPARYDDLVRIETALADVRSRAVSFTYVVRHAGSSARLASARTTLVALDRSGRPVSLPADFRARLRAHVSPAVL